MNKGGPLTTQAGCLSDLIRSSVTILKILHALLNRFKIISIFVLNVNKLKINKQKRLKGTVKPFTSLFILIFFLSFTNYCNITVFVVMM